MHGAPRGKIGAAVRDAARAAEIRAAFTIS
jgi:hypothetical protein